MNDIDYWNDLETIEKKIKTSTTKEDKEFWKKEHRKVRKEFLELYPYEGR